MLFHYEAELDAFLEFLIWRFSIWVDKPTPGIALMNLRYRDERAAETAGKGVKLVWFSFKLYLRICDVFFVIMVCSTVRTGLEGPGLTVAQKIWYCLATVGGQYIWARLQTFSAFRRWGDSEQVIFFMIFHSCFHSPRTDRGYFNKPEISLKLIQAWSFFHQDRKSVV